MGGEVNDEVKVNQSVTQKSGDDSTGNISHNQRTPPWAWFALLVACILIGYIVALEFGWW